MELEAEQAKLNKLLYNMFPSEDIARQVLRIMRHSGSGGDGDDDCVLGDNNNKAKRKEKKLARKSTSNIIGIADRFSSVSVVFCDLVGFTQWSARLPPKDLVGFLNNLFSVFDMISSKHGVEKIKTIGDCYMCIAKNPNQGSPQGHAVKAVKLYSCFTLSSVNIDTEKHKTYLQNDNPNYLQLGYRSLKYHRCRNNQYDLFKFPASSSK